MEYVQKEEKLVFDHKKYLVESLVTRSQLNKLEKYLDALFGKVGIDIEFTRHFFDRLQDERNQRPITIGELSQMFAKVYKKFAVKFSKMKPSVEAILQDMSSDINIPFALEWALDGKTLELRMKSILRKKNFYGSDKRFVVEANEKKFEPPAGAVSNAKKALKWKDEHGDEVKAMTKTGWTRARQLARGEDISLDIVKRMAQFNRHRKNSKISPEHKDEPWKDNGHVAWLGWGGDAGIDWAMSIANGLDEDLDFKLASWSSDGEISAYINGERYTYKVENPQGLFSQLQFMSRKSPGKALAKLKRVSMDHIKEGYYEKYKTHFVCLNPTSRTQRRLRQYCLDNKIDISNNHKGQPIDPMKYHFHITIAYSQSPIKTNIENNGQYKIEPVIVEFDGFEYLGENEDIPVMRVRSRDLNTIYDFFIDIVGYDSKFSNYKPHISLGYQNFGVFSLPKPNFPLIFDTIYMKTSEEMVDTSASVQESEVEVVNESVIDEVLTAAQRRKKARTMKKRSSRIQRGRKRKMRRVADKSTLQRRARKSARDKLKQRLAGGKKASDLSAAQKSRLEKAVSKRKKLVDRTAKRMVKDKRRADRSRKR